MLILSGSFMKKKTTNKKIDEFMERCLGILCCKTFNY